MAFTVQQPRAGLCLYILLWHACSLLPHLKKCFPKTQPAFTATPKTADAGLKSCTYMVLFYEIQYLNAELEDHVAQRTAEMALANRDQVAAKEAAEDANRMKSRFLAKELTQEEKNYLNKNTAALPYKGQFDRDDLYHAIQQALKNESKIAQG